jgi:thiol-disulfide isomerase/thioredoxin
MKIETSQRFYSYLFAVLISLTLFFLVSLIGGIGLQKKQVIGSILYLIATFLILNYYNRISRNVFFLIIVSPPLIVLLFINILNFKGAWVSFPSSFFIFVGCLLGYLSSKKTLVFYLLFLGVLNIAWNNLGQIPFENKVQYGSFSKKVLFKTPHFLVYDTTNNPITLSNQKITILDFWNSKCGPCYALFPFIDSTYKNIDTSRFDIFTVNIPIMNEKKSDNYKLLDQYHYTFKQSFAEDDSILTKLDIQVFPTTIVLKDNNVIYRGDFVSAIDFIKSIN